MIFMLQNLLHYTGDYISKENSTLTSSKYPEQNPDIINKLLFVPYFDENIIRTNYRLYISNKVHKEFTGNSGNYDNYTKVLRFDTEAPYVAILVDENDRIIVADSRVLIDYKLYPNYIYTQNFRGVTEAHLDTMVDWDTFNMEYAKERLWIIHVQNAEYLGMPVYVEYFNDLITEDASHNILPYEPHPEIDIHARYKQTMYNVPFRTTERGYVIRSDENGDEGQIVVMVVDEETGARKYILGSEAYFYIDTDDERVDIGDLNLWQTV